MTRAEARDGNLAGASVEAEWSPLREVMIHRPGVEMVFGLLQPYAFLYERAFSFTEAVREHRQLQSALEEEGVKVRTLQQLALEVAEQDPKFARKVRAQIPKIVRYTGPAEMVRRSQETLRQNLREFDAETLFQILLLQPSIRLDRRVGFRGIAPQVALQTPLANLCYMRDQQALTRRGFILGRMAKPQRRLESWITGSVLRGAQAPIVGEVKAPGTFEGGDFIPGGEWALLGVGDRTNWTAVRQILRMPLGYEEIAVVEQPTHPLLPPGDRDPMINMHLDTYVNLAGHDVAVGSELLLKVARTLVYRRHGSEMVRANSPTTLADYLQHQGVEIVPISTIEQMSYASNFLTTRDHHIVAVDVGRTADRVLAHLAQGKRHRPNRYGRLFRTAKRELAELRSTGELFPRSPALCSAGVSVRSLPLEEITGGYGGAHCLTCVQGRQ
jgi:arginine deiminase